MAASLGFSCSRTENTSSHILLFILLSCSLNWILLSSDRRWCCTGILGAFWAGKISMQFVVNIVCVFFHVRIAVRILSVCNFSFHTFVCGCQHVRGNCNAESQKTFGSHDQNDNSFRCLIVNKSMIKFLKTILFGLAVDIWLSNLSWLPIQMHGCCL